MDATIKFDYPDATYTNGDTIHGAVEIYCTSTVTLSKITVNLIGESKSTLTGTSGLLLHRQNREKHRIVNDTQDIIPYSHSFEDPKNEQVKLCFGYHTFPFSLQVPWFADCMTCRPKSPTSTSINEQPKRPEHGSRELPPSMHDLVKGVDISYRIDATMTIVKMFKETMKKSTKIKVMPIDVFLESTSPSTFPCTSTVEASIMGPHTLSNQTHAAPSYTDDMILLSTQSDPAKILVTASFPPDYTLTCNRDIAMCLRVTKTNRHPGNIYLQSFQMLLVGFTDITAQGVKSGQMAFWMIQSLSNIGLQIFDEDEDPGKVREVHKELWEDKKLDEAVVPSFETCNSARRYELEILMGFQCGSPKSRVLFVQLRVPVRISSGIRPGRRLSMMEVKSSSGTNSPPEVQAGMENGLNYGDEGSALLGRQSPPPTYDDAVAKSRQEGLDRERKVGVGNW